MAGAGLDLATGARFRVQAMHHQFQLDMTCGGCARAVTQALLALDPQARVQIDLPARTADVDSDKPRAELAQALAEAGYEAA